VSSRTVGNVSELSGRGLLLEQKPEPTCSTSIVLNDINLVIFLMAVTVFVPFEVSEVKAGSWNGKGSCLLQYQPFHKHRFESF
jgi:hypothetical protein